MKTNTRREVILSLGLGMGLIALRPGAAAAQIEVPQIAASAPAQFHGKTIAITGLIRKLRRGENSKSRPFLIFELTEENGKRFIAIRSYELAPIMEGQSVTVTGRFLEAPRNAQTGLFPSRRLGSIEAGRPAAGAARRRNGQ